MNVRALVVAVGTVCIATGTLQAQQPSAAQAPTPQAGAKAAATNGADAASLWQAIEAEPSRPTVPKEWQGTRPSQEVFQVWHAKEVTRLTALADRARDFAAQFPQNSHVHAAREKERDALWMIVQLSRDHNPAIEKRLDALEAPLLSDASVPALIRFPIRLSQIQRKAQSREEAEQMARALVAEFPDNPKAFFFLLQIAKAGGSERLRLVAEEIVKGAAPEEVKAAAKKILSVAALVGKPLTLQFTALDGQAVDLQKLKGKVVLIDFWATWCGPCVGEIPNVKAAYAKLHGQGFEILGISFDQDKDALTKFLKEKEMTWPQYFDGEGWKNRFGQEFGIDGIPTMWLVDKKGVLRDQEARDGLAEKVEKLLAEP